MDNEYYSIDRNRQWDLLVISVGEFINRPEWRRECAADDANNLIRALTIANFACPPANQFIGNCTKDAVMARIRALVANQRQTEKDMIAVAIMSHGTIENNQQKAGMDIHVSGSSDVNDRLKKISLSP